MQLACTTNNIFLKILVLNCLTYSKKKKLFPGSTKSPVSSWWQESSSIYSVGTSIQIFRASKYQSPERWVGRPARAAALARRAAPLPDSGQHYTSSASSGVWTAAGGRWAVASAASFGRLVVVVGETKGTCRPAKARWAGELVPFGRGFTGPSITAAASPNRRRRLSIRQASPHLRLRPNLTRELPAGAAGSGLPFGRWTDLLPCASWS